MFPTTQTRSRSLGALLATLLVVTGCQRPVVTEPLTGPLGDSAPETQLEFWHRLAERPVTSNDEAFHGLLLYLDGQDPATTYDQRVAALKARGLLPDGFAEPGEQALSRGTAALAIARALKIRGGLMMTVAPDSSRYALRELVYLNLFPQSSPNQTFSGGEFLGVVGRMEDWQRGNPDPEPPRTEPATQPGS